MNLQYHSSPVKTMHLQMCLWLTDGWCVDKMILLLKLNKLFQNLLWLAGKGILTDECRSSTRVVWALLLKWRTWILFPPMHLLKLWNCLKFEHEVHSLPTVTHIWASVTFLSSFSQKNVVLRMKVKIKSSFSHFDPERRQNVTVKLTWLQPVELIWSYIKIQGSLITQWCITKLKLVNSTLHKLQSIYTIYKYT